MGKKAPIERIIKCCVMSELCVVWCMPLDMMMPKVSLPYLPRHWLDAALVTVVTMVGVRLPVFLLLGFSVASKQPDDCPQGLSIE